MPLRANDLRGLGRKLGVAAALSRQRFDLSVALLPNVATSIIPLWAFIPRRYSVGPDRPGVSFRLAALFNNCVVWHDPRRSILDTYAELLEKSIGIPITPGSARLELPFTRTAGKKAASLLEKAGVKQTDLVIGMAPAARNKIKEVPPALYAEVADVLTEKLGARVVLTGSREDSEAAGAVLSAMRHRDRVVDASGTMRLSELPALIAEFDLFISVDSGPVYMAIALGVPSINLAGPCAMEERPLGPLTTVIQKDLPCAPCSYTFHTATTCETGKRECVTTLTAGPIIEAAEKLLERSQKKDEETGPPPAGEKAMGGR
jgi:ADP-heptose:LPS heptosyltransferase